MIENKTQASLPHNALNPKAVLLIEDEKFLGEAMERKFKASGYRFFNALNAASARGILAREKIDAILLDILLPDENGFSLLKSIKANEETKNIPVIIVTNLSQESDIKQGLSGGAVDYLVKSNIIPSYIVDRVNTLFMDKKGQASSRGSAGV